MKRLFLILAAAAFSASAMADEGMWTLSDLPAAVRHQMAAEGFTLPYDQLYGGDKALMKAVVNFGDFCSGVVVSPDGLVFTNHHCGFSAINAHSTVEHDYMRDGFCARSFDEELPGGDLFVSFMVEQKDITSDVIGLGIHTLSAEAQGHMIDSLENAMQKSVRAKDSTLRVEIKPFYEGNRYFATTYRDFRDVRLVFTVPKSMGKFGGETDNWMWPRQTCDFSVFRIYADPSTNGPAEYSKDNRPYRPEVWARVSKDGYKEGDYSMTIGYPGTTTRYLSSYGIRERHDALNYPRSQVRGVKQEVMWRHMTADEAVRIKYETAYASSSNYWKNSIGMNKCIDSIGLIRQKAEYEAKIRDYQQRTGYLKGQLDFSQMESLYAQRLDIVRTQMYFNETFRRTCELAVRARQVHNGATVEGKAGKDKSNYITFDDNSSKWDLQTDVEVFAALLKNYRQQVDKRYLPAFYATIDSQFGGDYTRYVMQLYTKSALMKNGTKIYPSKKKFAKDLGVIMGLDLVDTYAEITEPLEKINDAIARQERYLCAAKLRMEEDMPNYSDANFTMRLSYGQVGGFLLGGKQSGYYTTAKSIVEKMRHGDTTPDYFAEPVMHELLSAQDFGPYADKTTGEMQLCFLTNNDITGGNSGSPMFDGQGRLIGLAFDGNWDSLSSDIFFDSTLARCIGVDIRYVLYMMDKWGKADRLIEEIFRTK